MQTQANLFNQAVMCYGRKDPREYKDECTPAVREMAGIRFSIQELRGGQLQYKTIAEKTDMLNAGTKFDELFPAAINIVSLCAEAFQYHDFAKKHENLIVMKRWYDDVMEDYIKEIQNMDNLYSQALRKLVEKNRNLSASARDELRAKRTKEGMLRELGLDSHVRTAMGNWAPNRKLVFLYDMEEHRKILKGNALSDYREAYDYLNKEINKFEPFFSKWDDEIAKVASPYNESMRVICDAVRRTLATFDKFREEYRDILREANSGIRLGAFVSDKVVSGTIFGVKDMSYYKSLASVMDTLWDAY